MGLDDAAFPPRFQLHHQSLDPLPPSVERRPGPPQRRLTPEGKRILLFFVFFGNPWMARQIFTLLSNFDRSDPDDGALSTLIRYIVEVCLRALTWPVLVPDTRGRFDSSFWFGYQLRTLAFLAIALPLLSRLARTTATRDGRPDRLARGLAVFGAVLAAAVAAGVLSGLYFSGLDQRNYYPDSIVAVEVGAALNFGLVFGLGIGGFAALRSARSAGRRPMTPLGGE